MPTQDKNQYHITETKKPYLLSPIRELIIGALYLIDNLETNLDICALVDDLQDAAEQTSNLYFIED